MSTSDAEMVEYLLRKRANPDARLLMRVPAIVLAEQAKSTRIAELLLQAGADVNARDGDGITATMWSAQQNEPEVLSGSSKRTAIPPYETIAAKRPK